MYLKKIKLNSLLVVFITLILAHSYAWPSDKDLKIYVIRKDDNFKSIVEKIHSSGPYRNQKFEDFVNTVKDWNRHIENFENLKDGDTIYVSSPFPPHIDYKYAQNPKQIEGRSNVVTVPKLGDKESLNVFYMASIGTFTEDVNSSKRGMTTAQTKQKSPATLGVAANRKFGDRYWSVASSAYISYMNDSVSALGQKAKIPPEIGINAYFERYLNFIHGFKYYLGFDFEKFSTFNTSEILQGSDIVTKQNYMFFFTLGISKEFGRFFTKASYSKGLMGYSKHGKPRGDKFILFAGVNVWKKWSIQAFYKHHYISAPCEVKITRYGAGFSYTL